MASRGKVVVTGAEGVVAMAVERALRRYGFEVVRVVRGRELEQPIAEACAVVVLDAARRVAPADYETVLGAVALAVRDAPVERVVTVTAWPESGGEGLFAQVAARAEHDFVGVGVELRPIRFGLLVGVPDAAGPFDDALFETEPNAYVPGNGEQLIRPLLIGDLAEIVARAVVGYRQDDLVVWAEGPQELSLSELMASIRGARTVEGGRLAKLAVRAVAQLGRRLSPVVRQLPAEDLLLCEDGPPAAVLGVFTRAVPDVWTDAALAERPRRRKQALDRMNYRIPKWAGALASWLGMLGLVVLAVGVHDLLVVPTLGAGLVSLCLVLVGLFAIVGGIGLSVSHWQPRYAIAFLACVVMTALLAGLTVATWVNGDSPGLWVLWVLLAAPLIVGCLLIWQLVKPEVVDFMQTSARLAGSVLAAGVAVALIPFLYSEIYVPRAATPTVNVEVALEPTGTVGGMRGVEVALTLKNDSDHTVNVLAGTYRLVGTKVERAGKRSADRVARDRLIDKLMDGDPVRGAAQRVGRRLLDRGILMRPGVFLEPEEKIEHRFVVHVPAGLDVLSLETQLYAARHRFRDIAFTAVGVKETQKGPLAMLAAQIADPSLLQDMIRANHYVHVMYAVDRPVPSPCGPLDFAVYIDDEFDADRDSMCSRLPIRKDSHYGLTYTEASTELQLTRRDGGPD